MAAADDGPLATVAIGVFNLPGELTQELPLTGLGGGWELQPGQFDPGLLLVRTAETAAELVTIDLSGGRAGAPVSVPLLTRWLAVDPGTGESRPIALPLPAGASGVAVASADGIGEPGGAVGFS